MEKIGTVVKVYHDTADVMIMRASSCGENCAMCKGACTPTRRVVGVKNTAGACVGDKVIIMLPDKNVLLAAFFVYIVPIFLMIAGYILFNWYGAAAGLVLPLLILVILDKGLAKRYTATIIKIVGD